MKESCEELQWPEYILQGCEGHQNKLFQGHVVIRTANSWLKYQLPLNKKWKLLQRSDREQFNGPES